MGIYTLDVEKFFATNTRKMFGGDKTPVYWLLLNYFKDDCTAFFNGQTEIAQKLQEKYGLNYTPAQSAVSNAIKKLKEYDLVINKNTYNLTRYKGCYFLEEKMKEVKKSFFDSKIKYEQMSVHKISDNTLAFSIREKDVPTFIDKTNETYTKDTFFGIFSKNNLVILMFNDREPNFSKNFNFFLNFFKARQDYIDEMNIIKKRDKAIRKAAKKSGKVHEAHFKI